MVESERAVNGIGVIAGDIWLTGMRQAGLSEQEISRVVSTTTALAESGNGQGELVPVKEAAQRIGRSENTVRSWIRHDRLRTVVITPPPNHANGPWVHVDMTDVEELARGSDSESDVEELDRGPTPESGLITLREAADRFGVPVGRLHSWVYNGHLRPSERRLASPGPGGGKLLVDPADVARLVNPPKPQFISGPVTLRQAAERFGITVERVRGWYYGGNLQSCGRRDNGIILVVLNDVRELLKNPPRIGRPKRGTWP